MNGLLIPAIVSSIRSLKDGSVSICFDSQELSPMKAGELFGLRNKLVALYMSEKETIPQRELDQIDAVGVEQQGKTPSQRLRAVLFLNWKQDNEGYSDFHNFYLHKIERYIDELKANLP